MGLRVAALGGAVLVLCTACAVAHRTIGQPAGVLAGVGPPRAAAWHPPARPAGRGAYLVARLRGPLHTRFGVVPARTRYGERRWVPVLRRRGVRATVLVPAGPSARRVHIDLRGLLVRWTRVRVVIDLSSARLTVLRGARRAGSFAIGQGTPQTPTPTGRFFVDERLTFTPSSPYAPFALGLTARQTHLAPTWNGGDQIAIHPGELGAVSNGCIHAGLAAIRMLRGNAPLGTLVTVRS